ncbi:carbohydrate ABC transporter permease [bacterium]|nr:carbohydrate ABC transporter permease [bacterium]
MKALQRIGLYALVLLVVLYAVFPFYWAIVTSLKTGSSLFKVDWIPPQPSLENYATVLREESFLQSVINSVIVASTTSLLALGISILSSYSLARIPFRGRSLILLTILSVSMFPQIAVLSGMFELIRWMGLYNTLTGLSFCYLILVLPFTVWVMRGFMKAIPKELEEAAILDGCGPWRIVSRVFFPLIRPALATTGLLAFIAAWNEFLFALTFTLSSDKRTVPVAIAMLSGGSQYELPWGNIMAASVLVTLPLVVLVLVFQRHIVSGLTSGAVKG